MYDVLVIGGGSAGLTTSGIAANFGAKTMMVERERLGGDCTWNGCIPSKTLIRAASILHETALSKKYGINIEPGVVDISTLMKHIDQVREEIYEDADRPEIYEEMGIDVEAGEASFINKNRVKITDSGGAVKEVTAKYIFICTGGKPFIPPVEGLSEIEYLTNESMFDINKLPGKLAIVGAGPIGTEMAQAFNRLGSEVHVLDMAPRIQMNDDEELACMLQDMLTKEGIQYKLGAKIEKFEKMASGVRVCFRKNGDELALEADSVLMATGRRPSISSLNLDAAGVKTRNGAIDVDERCRTSVSNIYAVGDVTGRYQFTHMSEHMAKVATTNALIKIPMKIDTKHVPWVTFTDPELGQVGATERELKERGVSFEVYRFPFSKIDRAITDGQTDGLIKVFAKKWNGKILGASVLGAHAGEMISQYALAMKNGITLRSFADTIHPYPTYGLGARRAADQWYIKNQSSGLVKWIKRIFRYRGDIPDFSDPDRIV